LLEPASGVVFQPAGWADELTGAAGVAAPGLAEWFQGVALLVLPGGGAVVVPGPLPAPGAAGTQFSPHTPPRQQFLQLAQPVSARVTATSPEQAT